MKNKFKQFTKNGLIMLIYKRKEDVIRLIAEREMLTPELEQQINQATKIVEVEDLIGLLKKKERLRLRSY